MRIGIINIEPKICNTAYMQIAGYHRRRGDTVEWWTPLTDGLFERVYCSSLFDFTDKSEVPKHVICGGTGFDVKSRLPQAIEDCELDYSIYPKCDRSIIWFSRGCIRDCLWCIVREKEGWIRPVNPKNLNPNGKYIVVQDNNFFANPLWEAAINWLKKKNQPVDFQGIDARTLDEGKCKALLSLKHHKQIKIAWDEMKRGCWDSIKKAIKWIPPHRLMCYVLIGFNTGHWEDMARVEILSNHGIDPFVMPYDKNDLYQRAFARWVNNKAIYKKVEWNEYIYRVQKQEAAGTGWDKK